VSKTSVGFRSDRVKKRESKMLFLSSLHPYLLLAFGIVAEISATICLKLSDGFARPIFLIPVAFGYAVSFGMLALVLKTEDVGPVYAIWAGCGVALIGFFVFDEVVGLRELIGFGSVIFGVALLSR
jgi:small multidrug resistance pump